MFYTNRKKSLVSAHLRDFQRKIKTKDIVKNSEGNIIVVWFFVLVGMFILAMSYFFLYGAIHETLIATADASCMDGCLPGQQSIINLNNRVDLYWRFAHVMIAVGLIIYGILRSVRKEFDTYRQY
jgi:hypothetical protein